MEKLVISATLAELSHVLAGELTPLFKLLLEQKSAHSSSLPDTMTQQEVMKLLHVSKQTLINYRKQGFITAHSINGTRRVYYLRSEIEKLLKIKNA